MKQDTLLTPEYIANNDSKWPNKTIIDYLDEAIQRYPHKRAIVDHKSCYTYKELGRMVDRVALGLLEHGLQKGDVLSLQLPNWNEFIILHYAASKIGAITNPLVPIYRDREIGHMLATVEAKMLVIPDEFRGFHYPEMLERLKPTLPHLQEIFVLGDTVPETMKPLTRLIDEPWEERRSVAELQQITHDPNDVTEIIFTSGTTGQPKGVMHTHNTLCVSTNYWIDRLHLTADDVMFMASTFAHQTGFGYGVRLPTHYGGTAIYQDIWDPGEFLSLVESEKITFTAGATPFLQDTVQYPNVETYNLASLHSFVALGAPLPRSLVKEACAKVPFTILAGWGQTEDGLVTLTKPEDKEEKITGTDGVPFEGMELKIVDETGIEVPRNKEGDLLCRGPALFIGYYKQLEKTLEEFQADWFVTGDRAVMDDDGYIRIAGRNKDIIIRGGENIPVAYVENALYEHPDIAIVQLIAMPDPRLQEKGCACIRMKTEAPTLSLVDVQQFLKEKGVAKQYWPEHVEIVDDFPRTPSGKIQKYRLRDEISKGINET